MHGQTITANTVWENANKGFTLINFQERENAVNLDKGCSKNLGLTPRGKIVSCLKGRIWVTQEKDLEDYILEAGDSFMVTIPGRVIVEALEDARFSVNRSRGKDGFNGSYEKSIFK